MNDALRRALADARLREVDVASALGVDPKTVQRWLAGRVPHPRHRWAIADLLKTSERRLWSESAQQRTEISSEVRAVYPYRSAVPRGEWLRLFGNAQQEIDILVYAALFLAEDVEMVRLLVDKANTGVRVRLLLADPSSPQVVDRGTEEGIGDAVAARVHNASVLFRPLLLAPDVEARHHDTVLYNSIFRADEEMLVNPQVHGIAAAYAPVLDLHYSEKGGMFATYQSCFDRVWANAIAKSSSDFGVAP